MKPNILCLVSEDCPPFLSSYGNSICRTPSLDKFAKESIVFNNAYCTSPVCGPSRFSILTGKMPEAYPPAQHMRSNGNVPKNITTVPGILRLAGYYCTNNEKTDYNCNIDVSSIWDDCSDEAHWNNRPKGAPFFSIFNSMLTHECCVFDSVDGIINPEDVIIPPHLPDTLQIRNTLASYYNTVELMDSQLGLRLDELKSAGITNETVVLYYSDHASPMPRSKRFCYDDGLRVPLVLHLPEKLSYLLPYETGSNVYSPVSLVDLLPSILSIADLKVPSIIHGKTFLGKDRKTRQYAFSGRDRMDERYDLTRTARSENFRYIRNYSPHRPWGQHYAYAWLSEAYQNYESLWKNKELDKVQSLFWKRKPAEELYNSSLDPNSIDNIAHNHKYKNILKEMRSALDDHMLSINDKGFIPEFSLTELLENNKSPLVYPLEKVIELAGRVIKRDPSEIQYFKNVLNSDIMVLRYWAAQGLLMLSIEGLLKTSLLSNFNSEINQNIKIILAEAIGHSENTDLATEYLIHYLNITADNRLILQALNSLTYISPRSDLVLPYVSKLLDSSDPYIRNASEYLRLNLIEEYKPSSIIFKSNITKKE
tara:strand:+ start:6473 stop:8254 length:1782 start_codon:yes stop_codon:yes gene_type:complete